MIRQAIRGEYSHRCSMKGRSRKLSSGRGAISSDAGAGTTLRGLLHPSRQTPEMTSGVPRGAEVEAHQNDLALRRPTHVGCQVRKVRKSRARRRGTACNRKLPTSMVEESRVVGQPKPMQLRRPQEICIDVRGPPLKGFAAAEFVRNSPDTNRSIVGRQRGEFTGCKRATR
jgi:hypothetical protein